MNWRQRILVDWPNHPQNAMKARMALQQIEEGLAQLTALGHPLHIEEGYQPPPRPEYPKVKFHLLQGQRVVHNVGDEDELGEDWYNTMDEAKHAAGMTKQMQRGGIFSRALPSIFRRTSEDETALEEMNRVARETHRKFVNDQRAIHRQRADVSNEKRNGREL
jgi:putative ubiquitin-RnfH superfamily antitoxin RatB of RatAB toxin-antitoxin module